MLFVFKNREVNFRDVVGYIPIFSFLLSFVYHLQIEIDAFSIQSDVYIRFVEFFHMVEFGFLPGLFVSFTSLIATLIVASMSEFKLLGSFWKFWTLHALITFSFFFVLMLHVSDDTSTVYSVLDWGLIIFRLSIPYLISLPVAGLVTIVIADFGTRYLGSR